MLKPILFPRPQWMRERNCPPFRLTPTTPIMTMPGTAGEVTCFNAWLHQEHQLVLPLTSWSERGSTIRVGLFNQENIQSLMRNLNLRNDKGETVPEGYLIDVGPESVLVAGQDAAGVLHGLRLLEQLIFHTDSGVFVYPLEVHDWPYKPLRGAHLYMPSRAQIPFFHRLLGYLSTLRINTIFLEVGGGMRYDRHPEINRGWEDYVRHIVSCPGGVAEAEHGFPFPKDSTHYELAGGSYLEKDEVRQLLEWARSLHIEVIPEVQSLSHCYYLVYSHPEIAERAEDPYPDTYCPTNPATYELLFDVMAEVIEVFQPRTIHTGHDEIYTLGICPRCRDKNAADLLASDINKIHDFLKDRGIRMAMWGDKLMNIIVGGQSLGGRSYSIPPGAWFNNVAPYTIPETYTAIDQVPKDILILNWYWGIDPQAQEYFSTQGFEQIFGNLVYHGTGAFWGWNKQTTHRSVIGGEVSTWCDVSEYAYGHNAVFYNLAFSAEALWWNHYTEREQGRLIDTIANIQPSMRDRLGGRKSPSLSFGARFTPFPLPDRGAIDISGLPEGLAILRGVPFLLGKPGANALRVDSLHLTTDSIPIYERLDSILFLHHSHCKRRYFSTYGDYYIVLPTPDGLLGWYTILYHDGSIEKVEILYGENIANWNFRFGADVASCCYWAEPVWEGCDEEGKPVVLYRHEWCNPHVEKEVISVQLTWAGGEGEMRLAGVTGVIIPPREKIHDA